MGALRGWAGWCVIWHTIQMQLLEVIIARPWSSLVVGDEGWIGPSKKLLCLC